MRLLLQSSVRSFRNPFEWEWLRKATRHISRRKIFGRKLSAENFCKIRFKCENFCSPAVVTIKIYSPAWNPGESLLFNGIRTQVLLLRPMCISFFRFYYDLVPSGERFPPEFRPMKSTQEETRANHRNLDLEHACWKNGQFFSAGLHPILWSE
jgi:hypothetical protein